MIDLTNVEEIKKLDPKNVYESTGLFVQQCKQIHGYVETQPLEAGREIKNIVFAGMGGSAYGGHVSNSLFKDSLKAPIYVNSDYSLPAFVGSQSLVITASYSGSTEEVLQSLEEAKQKNAFIVGLASGGKLSELLQDSDYPRLIFDPMHNPSGQPRLGTGYMVLGTIELLRKLQLITLTAEEIEGAIEEVELNQKKIEETAKELSIKISSYLPIIITGDFFAGNAHILRNQFNETAKTFSSYHIIPEANHHLMEGLKNPTGHRLISLFIESDLFIEKIKKRIELTKEVINKNNIGVLTFKPSGTTKLSQSLEILLFGGYLTFYLAVLYGQDPSLIPWVDYFKKQLSSEK